MSDMPLASTTTTTTASNFLVPNGTFLAELVLFILVLGFVAVFILPPVRRAMDERDETIREGLVAGQAGDAEASELVREREAVLAAARADARAMLEEASRTAAAARSEAQARGVLEHDRVLAEAVVVIEQERRRVVADISGRLGSLVTSAAERVIGTSVDVSRHGEILQEALASIAESDSGEPGALR